MDDNFQDDDGLAWVNGIPRREFMWIPIHSPKPAAPVMATLLAGDLHSILIHHYKGRTVPHLRDSSLCEPCQAHFPTRGKIYLAGWIQERDRMVLIELTPNSVDEWRAKNNKPDPPFRRGFEIRVWRRGKNNNAPVVFDLYPGKLREEQLPPPFNVKKALKHIWDGDGKKPREKEAG